MNDAADVLPDAAAPDELDVLVGLDCCCGRLRLFVPFDALGDGAATQTVGVAIVVIGLVSTGVRLLADVARLFATEVAPDGLGVDELFFCPLPFDVLVVDIIAMTTCAPGPSRAEYFVGARVAPPIDGVRYVMYNPSMS